MKQCLAVSAALVLLICQVKATQKEQFLSCLSASTPAFSSKDAIFKNASRRSFVNDHVIPTALVLASTQEHVKDAVRCARRAKIPVCSRSGGHSLAGKSMCSGVLVDVGAMNAVRIDRSGVATLGAGTNLGELLWASYHSGRWFSAGVCPGVGVTGYILGGGHGPNSGSLGLACESMEEVTYVDRNARFVTASRMKNQELFWASCGAGGGQFGIVTSLKLRTANLRKFNSGVYFRYSWDVKNGGQMLHKWMDYNEMGGAVRMRVIIDLKSRGPAVLGYCFNVNSVKECERRLMRLEFFHTPGRKREILKKGDNALEMHAFLGPGGTWGKKIPTDIRKSILGQRYADAGLGNKRTHHSRFIKTNPGVAFWQNYTEYCVNEPFKTVPWAVCGLLISRNARVSSRDTAFPHSDSPLITHYIMGGGSTEEKSGAYEWMEQRFAKYNRGVYVNYPELEIKNYAEEYWGKSLCRLRRLKAKLDPDLFFFNPQPILPTSWKKIDECTPVVVRAVVNNPLSRFVRRIFGS